MSPNASYATTGAGSSLASYRPVGRFVEPGPAIARHAAGRPVPDAERDQGFQQNIGDRPDRCRHLRQRHIHPVRPLLDLISEPASPSGCRPVNES
jgi:hypothetical protein